MLRYTAEGSDLRNDMIMIFQSFATERVDRGGRRAWSRWAYAPIVSIYLAASAGDLRLTSTDPSVQPFLNYNYFAEEFDRVRMREGIHRAIKLGEHEAFKDIIEERIEPTDADLASDDALDDWMMRDATTGQPHILHLQDGACVSDPMAVVDQHGRVHGMEGFARGGRLGDAGLHPREHERNHDDDRRAHGGLHRGEGVGTGN